MTDDAFGGSTVLVSFTDQWVEDTVTMPAGRLMANGSDAILITHVLGYVRGKGGSRSGTVKMGSCSASYTAASASAAASTGWLNGSDYLTSASTLKFRITMNGSFYFGRSSSGSSVDSYGTTFAGALGGSFRYFKAPTAPTIGTVEQAGTTEAEVSWSAPSDDGDTALTGYRILYSTDPAFAGATQLDVGLVTSYTLTGLTPGTQVYVKVAARNAVTAAAGSSSVYSSSASVVLVSSVGDLDGWASFGTLPGGLTPLIGAGLRRGSIYPLGATPVGLLREIEQAGTGGPITLSTIGIERTFTGLVIGATYELSGTALSLSDTTPTERQYRWEVVGVGAGSDSTAISDDSTPRAIPTYSFVATGTSHTVRIAMRTGSSWSGAGWWARVGFYDLKLTEIPVASPYRLQDIAYEGSLASHFDIANLTVGGAWWIDRENVTQFRQAESQDSLKALFSDVRADGAHEYTGIAASYDTRNVVNLLTVTNLGRDAGTGDSADIEYSVADGASVALWGSRPGDCQMSMRSGYIVRTNLVPNPGAEIDLTNIGGTTASQTKTRSTSQFNFGVASVAAQRTGSTGPVGVCVSDGTTIGTSGTIAVLAVTAGVTYTASAYARMSGTGRACAVKIRWYNASNVVVGSDTVPADVTLSTSAWTRLTATAAAPATATKAVLYVQTASTATVSDILYVDGMQFEAAGAASAFLDGDVADTLDLVREWSGTAHNSASVERDFTHLNDRIDEILADHDTPEVRISGISWNAQENPLLAATLDVQDRVSVAFKSITQESRIVGIKHEIGPKRWMIRLELVPA